jgi:hypothetical protein
MKRARDPAPQGRSRAVRPCVEELESRSLLSASFASLPIVPVINAVTQAHLRAVLTAGIQQGNRLNVFAKVGDSITVLPASLTPLGDLFFDPSAVSVVGTHGDLASTIAFYRFAATDDSGSNSFNRESLAAGLGWTAGNVLTPTDVLSPLQAELQTVHPTIALIELGTNDLIWTGVDLFRAQLTEIATETLQAGVIPVLATVPDSAYSGGMFEPRVPVYNQIIADVAAALDVPLWNYWLALRPLPGGGLSADGVHPSTYFAGSQFFTDAGLQYGFNVRNFTAVEALAKLKRVVLEGGAPDGPVPLTAETVRYVTGLYQALLNRAPDSAGLAFFGTQLQTGTPRAQVVQEFWRAPEHRGLEVDALFSKYLHRAADVAGRTFFIQLFLAGASKADIQADLLTSHEYLALHFAAADYVTALYQDVLQRDPDPTGEAVWVNLLQNGGRRLDVVQAMLAVDEYNRQIIDGLYLSFLQRPADPVGEQALLNVVRGQCYALELAAELILRTNEFLALQP